MARVITLHVGLEKTATTYVQHGLAGLRAELLRHGVLYPGTRHAHHGPIRDRLQITSHVADDAVLRRAAAGSWNRLCGELEAHPGDAIVSCEYLSWATAEEAAALVHDLPAASVRVLVTTRPLGDLLPSLWQEQVRHGESRSLHAWIDGSVVPAFDGGPDPRRLARVDLTRVVANWKACASELRQVPMGSGGPDLLARVVTACELPSDLADRVVDAERPRHAGDDRLRIELTRRVMEAVPSARESLAAAGIVRPAVRLATHRYAPDPQPMAMCARHVDWAGRRDPDPPSSIDPPDADWCRGVYDGGPAGPDAVDRASRRLRRVIRLASGCAAFVRRLPGVESLLVSRLRRTQY